MRFRRLSPAVFGPLRARDFELSREIVLVQGPNESGKSSFRSALETILYGFAPASRDNHPLFQWDEEGGDLRVEAELELDDETAFRVERVLQSSGKCRLAEPGEPFEGARGSNVALDAVGETHRELFRTIYSLAVDDLVALSAGSQARVDHLLLPAHVCEGVRPTTQVLAETRKAHTALWRADERGKTRARELRNQLAEARRDVRRAADEEEAVRSALQEREKLDGDITVLRAQRAKLETAERDAPFLKRLFELDYRRRTMPAPVDFSELGDDKLQDPNQLADEIRELEESLEPQRARLARDVPDFDASERAILERADEIESALRTRSEHSALVESVRECTERLVNTREAHAAELSAIGVRSAGKSKLDGLSLEVLRSRREAWEAEREAAAAKPRGALDARAALLAVVGVGGVVASWLGEDPLYGVLGAVVLLGAVILAARASSSRNAQPPALDAALAAELHDAGVDATFTESPSALQRLIDALERLRRAATEIDRLRVQEADGQRRQADIEGAWNRLARDLGIAAPDVTTAVANIDARLVAARRRELELQRDQAERNTAEEACRTVAPTLARKHEARERLERFLRRTQPKTNDVGLAYEEVQRRLQEEQWLERQEAELRADPLWSRLSNDLRAHADIEPSEAPWDPAQAEARRAEIDTLEVRMSSVDRRRGELAQLLADDPGARQARAREVVLELEAELALVQRERDRLAFFERLLERADHHFREAHQPDVLRRAGTYLALVTSGRYTRLDADPTERAALRVYSEERGVAIPAAPPLSRGTCDQIQLCLRLGLLDHIDDERERLPLVLDEVLVHWDDERRAAVYPLLKKVAESRQVFLLTCHEHIAAETERGLGIERHSLTPEERAFDLSRPAAGLPGTGPLASEQAARESVPGVES